MKRFIAGLLLCALNGAVFAQATAALEAAPEVRRYSVEIIIFSYAESVSAGSEIFVPEVPPDPDPDSVELEFGDTLPVVEAAPVAATNEDPDARQFELVMLTEDEFQLQDAYDRLRRLDAYTPLLHFGWTQPTYPDEESIPRPLSTFVTPPPGLQGELSLYLSRYLHLAVDLQMDGPSQDVAVTDRHKDDRSYTAFDDSALQSYPVRYRIKEDRIFRNGELRYFDHPKFGMLAKVSRVVEDEEPGELLGD